MSRFKVLRANPRRALAAMATLLVAVGVTAASGASFTATSANAGNTFSSGTLSIGASSSAALFNMTNIRPGATATGVIDIQNTGSLSGVFTLSRSLQTDTGIADKINLVVTDCGDFSAGTPTCGDPGDVQKYSGTLAEMGTTGHLVSGLGTFAANEKHKYQFAATFDSNADDTYQNKSATATFTWDAA